MATSEAEPMERIGATCKKQSLLVIIKFDRSSKQVDHMNGLKDDVENIRFLRSNCHTQTSNCGGNIADKIKLPFRKKSPRRSRRPLRV